MKLLSPVSPAFLSPASHGARFGVPTVPSKTFGERLKELREQAGLTQPELAERAGMNRFGIAKLEQGVREPTWATVQALAKALGVNCGVFEGTAPAEEPPPEPPKPRKPKK